MAKAITFIQKGDNIDFTNNTETDISYRDVVPSGSRIFIAGENIKVGTTGTLVTCGVYELPAASTEVFEFGESLYWDSENGRVTKTVGDIKAGYAIIEKVQSAETAYVKIN